MGILSDALPKLAKGVLKFGLAASVGLVHLAAAGLTELLTVISFAGGAGNAALVAGAAAVAAIGLALTGIGKVLDGMAKVMLAFAGSIVIIVGAIWLATQLFTKADGKKVGPLGAMLIIIGAITILAGGMALIGVMSPLIVGAGVAIKALAIGLASLGLGLLVFVGTIALVNAITGGPQQTMDIVTSNLKVLGLMTLLFAGMGIFGGLIAKGGKAAQQMGLGMGVLGLGILVLGGVFALLGKMKVDADEMFTTTAKGIGKLALLYAGIGLFSPLIVPGILTLFAMTVSLALFGLAMLEMGGVIKKLGGKEGIKETTQNIADMINIVTSGVLGGLFGGLGKEKGEELDRGDVVQFRRVRKALKILTGIASSLSSFAMGLTAFSKAGQITEVTYDEKTGKPIYGKTIFVAGIAENMVSTFNTFISGLITNTIGLTKKHSKALIKFSKALVGKGQDGGIISGVIQFADALQAYAKFGKEGKIFIPEFDENGNPVMINGKEKKTAILLTDIVNTIVKTFGEFATKLSSKASLFTGTSTYALQIQKFNEALMGKTVKGLWGLRTTQVPGMLTGIMEFSNLLNAYAKFGIENKIPVTDENGKITPVPVDTVVTNMFSSIESFLREVDKKVPDLERNASDVQKKLKSFTAVIESFDVLYKTQTGLDSLTNTMERLAQSFAVLVSNTKELDVTKLQKLVDINSAYAKAHPNITAPSAPGAAGSAGLSTLGGVVKIDPADVKAIVDAITDGMKKVQITNSIDGTFKFEFMRGDNEGNISFNK